MNFVNNAADLTPAITELLDSFARVKAQVHVLRLAMQGLRDEGDIRALMCQLGTIEDELVLSENMLRLQGNSH